VSASRPVHVDDEVRIADEMARELEALAGSSLAVPPAGFAERVMASVAREPLPQPARAFGVAVGARRLGAALASVGDAWRVAVGGRAPIAVRAQALALVLVVALATVAVAGGAAVGAIDLLNATQPPQPSPTTPQPSQIAPSPSSSPIPSTTPSQPSAEPSAEPSPSGEGTDTTDGADGGGTSRPSTATPRPTRTEDSGGGGAAPTPTGTDESGGSGGDGETPGPTATDDHGGGDG
jgi:hypothetical protein